MFGGPLTYKHFSETVLQKQLNFNDSAPRGALGPPELWMPQSSPRCRIIEILLVLKIVSYKSLRNSPNLTAQGRRNHWFSRNKSMIFNMSTSAMPPELWRCRWCR